MTPTRVPRLGPRGEGWVALQSAALVAAGVAGVLGPGWPRSAARPLVVAGIGIAAAGGVLGAAGIRHLGDAITPFPAPAEGATMRDAGAFGLVRHPIYGGILLVAVGWSLLTSPVALLPTAALASVFEGKRRREEAWLIERHAAYLDYADRVRRRFIPFVW
ncbi:MAG TPA: isoprenylcysteine carboxylmethyltransferase family protein [Actinomycetota bacterium]|nr:isoprenylcysteine carboxylmethyltransferase family protein [Actinomycetota bacterium]